MKKIILIFALLWTRGAFGQCTATAPCVPVQVTSMVNQNTALLICVGDNVMCSQTTLNAYISGSTTTSWKSVGFFQKASTVTYNDPHSYGSTISYAAYSTPPGGPNGPVSAITIFQMPQAPQAPPTLIAGPKIVTTGSTGVQ